MARNPKKPSDNYIFSSEENLEKQAELMEKLADKVARNMERKFESVTKRLSESQEKEFNKWDKTVQDAAKRWHEGQEGNGLSFKQNLAANILNQTGAGQQFDANWKSVGATIGKTILEGLGNIFSIYITKPIQQGFHDMSSAYETNFTEIAGRMGTNRDQTYNIMKDTVNSLSGSFKNAIDANNELIPELRKVSGQGFTGDKAISQAFANAVDAKLMPWLDTASDTWANLSFNLSKTQMQQIKGQQLLLQETQSGNRLLQSGIINQLTNDIAPVLTNIDLNTGGAQNLAPEAQAHMVSLMDQGYSAQEAYAAVQENLKVWKDPTAGFDKGDYSSVMKAQAAYLGGDYSDIASADAYGYELASQAGNNAGFILHGLGTDLATGVYRAEGASQYLKGLYGADWDSFKDKNADQVYQSLADRVSEKVTATQSHDNWLKNTTTQVAYGLNSWAHGPEVITEIGNTLKKILQAIIGGVIGNSVLKWATGGQAGKGLIETLFTSSGKSSTIQRALSSVAGKSPIFGTGATKAGTTALGGSGGLYAAAALPALAGTAIGAYGVKEGISDIQDGHEVRGGLSIAGGAAAAAGGIGVAGGMIAAGAANAWNPVGWGLLLGGAVTVAATSIHKAVTPVMGLADAVTEKAKEMNEKNSDIVSEQSTMLRTLKLNIDDESDLNEIKKEMLESGIFTETQLRGKSADSLKSLIDATIDAKKQLNNEFNHENREISGAIEAAVQQEQSAANGAIVEEITKRLDAGNDIAQSSSTNHPVKALKADSDTTGVDYADVANLMQSYVDAIQNEEQKANSQEMLDAILEDKAITENEARIFFDENTFASGVEALNSFAIDQDKAPTRSSNLDVPTITYETNAFLGKDVYPNVEAANTALDFISSMQQEYLQAEGNDQAEKQVRDKFIDYMQDLKTSSEKTYDLVRPHVKGTAGIMGIPEDSYAVGTPYLYHDTVAQLHEGEAVLTKSENKARLAGLLGLDNKSRETSNLSATEIVNAITSQTNELKQAINEIINTITSNSKQTSFNPRINNSIEMMMPTIANTRNLGVR